MMKDDPAGYVREFFHNCHADSLAAGWWKDGSTHEQLINNPLIVPTKLMLIVSEVAEAMEGYRKNLADDKLPHRDMLEVELADAIIRIADLAGACGYDLYSAVEEKRAYNRQRADHKLENRGAAHGKRF